MKYTIAQFRKEFPDDDACLDYIFKKKYPNLPVPYYRLVGRKAYANAQGDQLHPLKGTIFEKSSTPLSLWFHAIFLFASAKNGVSAAELQRQLGVTYKTAWRMGHQVRSLMQQGTDLLTGVVEVDETYFGKKGTLRNNDQFTHKSVLIGMVERKGMVRARVIPHRGTEVILPLIREHIEKGSRLMTDEAHVYKKVPRLGYRHGAVKHGKGHYVHGDIHTNTIEGFWGQLKRSIRGTYHFVSKKYFQAYVNEFAWYYNHRASTTPRFSLLLDQASR